MMEAIIVDMHAHLSGAGAVDAGNQSGRKELKVRRDGHIITCFSSGTPNEWSELLPYREREELLFSFGIHPWYADQYETGECMELLKDCDVIGEIGMDSVWCQVSNRIQQIRLEEQLQIAADLEKPVILHTKGQEERIADIIRDFPGKICVHWYSGERRGFEKFRDAGCYFTLGPDFAEVCKGGGKNYDIYRFMLEEIPPDRLFVETDGISSIAWVRGKKQVNLEEIPEVLRTNMEFAAAANGMAAGELAGQMVQNLRDFLSV